MKPKVTIKLQSVTKVIDYRNGFKCEYVLENENLRTGKTKQYRFYNKLYQRLEVVDDETLELLKNSHWSTHHEHIKEINRTEEELFQFNEFDKLYYIGGGIDGMLAKSDGTFIATAILLDDIFFHCYIHLETTQKECEDFLNNLKKEHIIKSDIVYIPYYNQNENCNNHYTLSLLVMIPDEIYTEIIGDKKYLDDICKLKIVEYLKINK